MKNMDKIIRSAMTAFLAMTAANTLYASASDQAVLPAREKCYGIVKAGLNDCATAHSSCAGSSLKDKQNDAFLFLPQGVCEKIVGGQLKPEQPTN